MELRNTYRLLISLVKETKKLPSLVTLDGADTYSAITRYLKVLLPSSVSSYSSVRISKQLNAMDVLTAGADNVDAQLSALQSSGYASDPRYAFKLRNIMNGLPDEEGQG